MSASSPLSAAIPGVRILDLSRLLPGPYTTRLLADLGAEVIKVETPLLGDYARHLGPGFGGDTMFRMLNRGKRSLGLNYRNRQGREIFLRLAEQADVVVESFRPGSMERWGLGYPRVRERNPRIIYCSLSGYGQEGPFRDRPGHDLNYLALSGMLGLTSIREGPPAPLPVQVADLNGGMFAAIGILAALLRRQIGGEGAFLDIAMMDTVVHWLLPTAGASYYSSGQAPRRESLPLMGAVPCYAVYQAEDGRYLALGALESPFWGAFCTALDRPDLISSQFDPAAIPVVQDLIRSRPAEAWLTLMEGKQIPIDLVQNVAEALGDPRVNRKYPRPGNRGDAALLPSLFPFKGAAGEAPALGEDSLELLMTAGYDRAEIDRWIQSGLVRTGPGSS